MKQLLSILLMLSCTLLSAQEICNNGIDDDGDGLIDLQDTDCDCDQILPSGLIPNESFEENDCIPMNETSTFPDIECLIDWIQAAPTSDYFHLDGMTYPTWITPTQRPPLPIPDGRGYLGFRDGRGSGQPNYKEYVGACLTEAMVVGKTYRLDFYLGFPLSTNSIDMTIYGTTECSNLPFSNTTNTGCPSNNPGWEELDHLVLTGDTEWLNVVFDLNADKPFTAIILGPGCGANANTANHPYFFVDRLNLVELVDEELPFTSIEGSLCEEFITLELDLGDEFGYQWYKDGIAIDGEVSNTITIDIDVANYGGYSVLISTPVGCLISETLEITVPQYEENIEATICEGESFAVEGEFLNATGIYSYDLTAVDGCDSLLIIDLEVLPNAQSFLTPNICEGEVFTVAGEQLSATGNYFYSIPTDNGCDSIITVVLTVHPRPLYSETIEICEGDIYVQDGDVLSTSGNYIYVYPLVTGCDSTYFLELIVNQTYEETSELSLCEGDRYLFGDMEITTGGVYISTLSSGRGCDSNVVLTVVEASNSKFEIAETICQGEDYFLQGESYTSTGIYELTITNQAGCDSTIILYLDVVEHIDDVILPGDTLVILGEDITVIPDYLSPDFFQFIWTDESGDILSSTDELYIPIVTGRQEVSLLAVDQYGCVDQDEIVIRVDRNIGIYAANIYSPNGDGINDYFRPEVNASIIGLKEMAVYDRWGNLVYQDGPIMDLANWFGWDGNFNGKEAVQGVYVFVATFIALDDEEETISGDITLIR